MTKDIRLAFAHPSERSEAMDDASDPCDRISLRDHVVEVEIGAFQVERGATQRVRFNVVVELRPIPAPLDDDVDRVLSYDTITDAIATELAAERLNLLETLAERIAQRLLSEPQPTRVFVRIEKLDRGPGALGVEIVRSRVADLTPVSDVVASGLQPTLLFLSNEAIAAAELPRWLDKLEATGAPVILCVGPADGDAPQSKSRQAQRRIDLLATEQNAWVLAGRDKRCVVTNTRTEIEWAMKHGQISVWAPSKIVLDAVDGPSADPSDAVALSLWFAEELDAGRIVVIGAKVPGEVTRPVQVLSCDLASTAL
ncbi:dihydroneopterin aldolase [Actibacterium lipolyticum]|uniref:dihydroneopterin aldolase n=1 Tax=Actibacterium lipolyticum TaxID=1524263 RepID=A0A238KKJ5_9RHOB|nr:dihydroneopterin aldolase [Actibacterium lipolyticum]SMX43281.1 bifunctional dihydroneopterin aldolase/dihydroneopterin triphosphate 2'-epimerase [Actibacterium lipolyticum]